MKNVKIIMGSLLCLFFIVTACENKNTEMQQEKEELRQEIEDLQTRVGARLDELGRQIDTATVEMKDELQVQMTMLERKSQDLNDQLNELEAETAETWKEFKTKVRSIIDDIEQDLDS